MTGELEKRKEGEVNSFPAENRIQLGSTEFLDLSGLKEEEISELKRQHAQGMIDISKKAAEMGVDVQALDNTLRSFVDQTNKATQDGSHSTITHTQTTSIGRTEVVVGNTETAQKAKMTRSALGQKDITIAVVIIGAIALVIVAMILRG